MKEDRDYLMREAARIGASGNKAISGLTVRGKNPLGEPNVNENYDTYCVTGMSNPQFYFDFFLCVVRTLQLLLLGLGILPLGHFFAIFLFSQV